MVWKSAAPPLVRGQRVITQFQTAESKYTIQRKLFLIALDAVTLSALWNSMFFACSLRKKEKFPRLFFLVELFMPDPRPIAALAIGPVPGESHEKLFAAFTDYYKPTINAYDVESGNYSFGFRGVREMFLMSLQLSHCYSF